MNISRLRRGEAVELLVDAHAIPAGCYRFHEIQGEISVFTVGPDIIIGLATDFWTQFMRPGDRYKLSSVSEFATRYGRLQAQLTTQDSLPTPSQITFCILSSRIFEQSTVRIDKKAKFFDVSALIN